MTPKYPCEGQIEVDLQGRTQLVTVAPAPTPAPGATHLIRSPFASAAPEHREALAHADAPAIPPWLVVREVQGRLILQGAIDQRWGAARVVACLEAVAQTADALDGFIHQGADKF